MLVQRAGLEPGRRAAVRPWVAAMALMSMADAGLALAQEPAEPKAAGAADAPAAPAAGAGGGLQEIVVTGTRIALQPGASSPTPTTVLDASTVQAMGVPNIGAALNQLPAFLNDGSPSQSEALSPQNIGSQIVDLRGLGAVRTLVLVDGQRFVPSTQTGTIDLNLIPSMLVERTDIVTGGASAAYGSDAVAGVVNVILNTHLDGIRSDVQYGIAQAGDNKDTKASLAGGTDWLGGKAHVIAGFEYEKNGGMGDYYSRGWSAQEWCDVANSTPGVNGYAANNILPHCHSATMTPGGLIVGGPLNGTQFSANGTPEPFHYGVLPGFLFMSGGDGYGKNPFFLGPQIEPDFDRYSFFSRSDFNVTDAFQPYVELSYGHVHGTDVGAQLRAFPGMINLTADNPYLPASIVTQMNADGLSAITLGRAGNDLGNSQGESDTSTVRFVAGARGALGGTWTWDGYYEFGHNKYDQYEYDDIIPARLALAVDAVTGPNGSVICRSTLTNPGNGCQPLDLIGENNFSAAARQYIMGTSEQLNHNEEHVLAANVQGEPLQLWEGPWSVAAGVEYRNDSLTGTADPISQQNGYYVFNGQNIAGSVHVTEGYFETVVPLLKNLPLAKDLELNAAARETSYSTSGFVTTWKAGAVYEPDDLIRLRATRSRDIRAPNIFELFSPVTAGFTTVIDAKTGVETLPHYYTGGNPNLKPEIADTTTAGIVLTPKLAHLEGLTVTIDYYNIKVRDVITEQGGQTILDNCEAGDSADCALLARDANGNVSAITDTYQNANGLFARGVDFEIDYGHALPGTLGTLNFRGLGSYVSDLTTISNGGLQAIDQAGVDGVGGVPHIQATTFLTWKMDPWSVTVQNRYVGGGKFSPLYIGPQQAGYSPYLPNSINTNWVPGRLYTNLSAAYDFNVGSRGQLEAYAVINNLFGIIPPVDPGAASSTNTQLFDAIGRAFTVGVRLKL